jgi:predicted unusual protein kinase regulating ubiquinone biosynthesis (AarF/ABC1/UbiB family)
MPDWRTWPYPTDEPPTKGDGIDRGRLRRTVPLAALSARTAGEAVVVGLRGKLTGAERAESQRTEFHIRTAESYAELLGRSKGALMKAGQMLSCVSAGPALPAEFQSIYHEALARLHDDAPPMAPELARIVLEHELDQRTECAFAEFDWEPLAAASIGQVHAARLHDGREVAVKIQYPGVADAIRADLKNTELLATFLSLIGAVSSYRLSLDLRGAAREMTVRITEELDYRREAANQAEFAEHYRGHPFIHVPGVVAELCTGRVLTQELVRGRPWSEALTAEQELRDQWAEAIHRFTYGSYHRLCSFNADPHPGNYMFHDDGSVSFLDFGCVKRLQREQVTMVEAIAGACFRNDVLGTWRACVEAGLWRSSDPVTPEEAFAWWRHGNAMFGAGRRLITPVSAAKMVEHRYSPSGPAANALRYLTMPPEYTMLGRIEMAVSSVIGQLHARVYLGSLIAELFEGGTPITSMGKLDHAFFTEREGEREGVAR